MQVIDRCVVLGKKDKSLATYSHADMCKLKAIFQVPGSRFKSHFVGACEPSNLKSVNRHAPLTICH